MGQIERFPRVTELFGNFEVSPLNPSQILASFGKIRGCIKWSYYRPSNSKGLVLCRKVWRSAEEPSAPTSLYSLSFLPSWPPTWKTGQVSLYRPMHRPLSLSWCSMWGRQSDLDSRNEPTKDPELPAKVIDLSQVLVIPTYYCQLTKGRS